MEPTTYVYSLVVCGDHAECIVGQLGSPERPDAPFDWQGRELRLVHEQRQRDRDATWFIYGDIALSKPETLARARQWADSAQHPHGPNLREEPPRP